MTAYLVRHAKAGVRSDLQDDDRLRPLTKSGKRQAEGLVEVLRDAGIQAVLSSPYLRCVQTVEPLAQHFRLPVDLDDNLAEGAGGDRLAQLIGRFPTRNVALCTHGDVLQEFLEQLIQQAIVSRAHARIDKGSTWVVTEKGGRITEARYLPAP